MLQNGSWKWFPTKWRLTKSGLYGPGGQPFHRGIVNGDIHIYTYTQNIWPFWWRKKGKHDDKPWLKKMMKWGCPISIRACISPSKVVDEKGKLKTELFWVAFGLQILITPETTEAEQRLFWNWQSQNNRFICFYILEAREAIVPSISGIHDMEVRPWTQ